MGKLEDGSSVDAMSSGKVCIEYTLKNFFIRSLVIIVQANIVHLEIFRSCSTNWLHPSRKGWEKLLLVNLASRLERLLSGWNAYFPIQLLRHYFLSLARPKFYHGIPFKVSLHRLATSKAFTRKIVVVSMKFGRKQFNKKFPVCWPWIPKPQSCLVVTF